MNEQMVSSDLEAVVDAFEAGVGQKSRIPVRLIATCGEP